MYLNKKKKNRWKYSRIDDPLKIPYTGIPFILLGKQQYQCHQRKDINYKKKKLQGEKNAKLITDHTFTKYRKLVQDTKKKGCLLVFNTKKLFTFPKYKIPARYNRGKAAKSVKKFLSSLEQSKGKKEKVLDEEYHLS